MAECMFAKALLPFLIAQRNVRQIIVEPPRQVKQRRLSGAAAINSKDAVGHWAALAYNLPHCLSEGR